VAVVVVPQQHMDKKFSDETKQKIKAGYKTLYIRDDLTEKLNDLAKKYDTSFNNIVISIIEDFFQTNDEENH